MNIATNQTKIQTHDDEGIPRRSLLMTAPLAALSAAIAAGDIQAATDISLSADMAGALVSEPSVAAQIAYHVERIAKILYDDAPAGAVLRSFNFRCLDGEVLHNSIWATAINDDCRLYVARPLVFDGWRDRTPTISGGLCNE